jgi:ElaB/YqjD/DUF883 family membrane-anchored ribosome-binding protein
MAESNGRYGTTRDRLLDDLKLVIRSAEDMLRSTGQQAGESYDAARARFETTISTAKDSLGELEQKLTIVARDALETTDEYVHQNPWQSVGIGALAGLLVGLWIGRR